MKIHTAALTERGMQSGTLYAAVSILSPEDALHRLRDAVVPKPGEPDLYDVSPESWDLLLAGEHGEWVLVQETEEVDTDEVLAFSDGVRARRHGATYWTNPWLHTSWEETHRLQGCWSEGWLDEDRVMQPGFPEDLRRSPARNLNPRDTGPPE